MNFTIRHATDGDFPAVTALEESGLHEPYRSAIFVRQMGKVCPETFLDAVLDDGAIGYTIGTFVQHNPIEAWILRIGVEESFRRNGVGSALLKSSNQCASDKGYPHDPAERLTRKPACGQALRATGIHRRKNPTNLFWYR
jgi:GNAT superfamily N-acetyltransferase